MVYTLGNNNMYYAEMNMSELTQHRWTDVDIISSILAEVSVGPDHR